LNPSEYLVVVRGGGDLATGVIWTLVHAGFPVVSLECAQPSAIRRTVAFSEAVYEGTAVVEGLTCTRVGNAKEAKRLLSAGGLPMLVDPQMETLPALQPAVLVDAVIAKRNLGTKRGLAPCVIALGPGFTAGVDCDAVVETMRGHNLGRILREGSAMPNTGIPGVIRGFGAERVIHADRAGKLTGCAVIGDFVEKGQKIAEIHGADGSCTAVAATMDGLLRGLIRDDYPVVPGFKIADIDPRREERANCFTISDKARALGGAVLLAIMEENV